MAKQSNRSRFELHRQQKAKLVVPSGYQRIYRAAEILDVGVNSIVRGLRENKIDAKHIGDKCYVSVADCIRYAERAVRLGHVEDIPQKAKEKKAINELYRN